MNIERRTKAYHSIRGIISKFKTNIFPIIKMVLLTLLFTLIFLLIFALIARRFYR